VITVINRGGVILSQSHAMTRVLGYEQGELVGCQFFEYVHEGDIANVHAAFLRVVEGVLQDASIPFRHRVADGSYRIVEAAVCKLRSGSAACVIFSMRPGNDVRSALSGNHENETDLASASLAKDRFLAVLSHELRTPLTPALLGLIVLESDERFAEARPTLAMIRRNLELQSRLIEELMNFVAVGRHNVRLDLKLIDAHEAIRSVIEICQSDIDAAKMEVSCDLRASDHWVRADWLRLQQVMWNLLKNAIKFSPHPGSLCISTANEAAGQIAIEFVDHGVGIEPELLPLVFDPFQQGAHSNPQYPAGLGLGLFIANGLAVAQQGNLSVTSEGKGHGARFRLTFSTTSPGATSPTSDPLQGPGAFGRSSHAP
jgi:PAS domain S-box-containing protein